MSERFNGLLVLTLFGVLFLVTADNQILIPLLPTLGRHFGVSMEELGWLFSAYALAGGLFNLGLGPLSDRFGRVPFIQAGLLCFSLLGVLTWMTASYAQLLVLRMATGLAAGLLSTCIASLVGDFFPYARRGRIMGFVLSSYFAALILGVPLGAWIAESWEWRRVFLCSSAAALLLLASGWICFPRLPLPSRPARLPLYYRGYPSLLRRRETAAALLVSFAVSGGTLVFLTFISGYLDQRFGLNPVEISWLFLIAGVAAAIGSPLSGWLSDRLTKRKIFLLSNTLLAGPLAVLDWVPWGAPLIALFFTISLCIAFRQTALHTLQTELVAIQERGTFLALRNSCSQLGISASIFGGGLLYSEMGYGAVARLSAGLMLLSSGIFYLSIREPEVEPEES